MPFSSWVLYPTETQVVAGCYCNTCRTNALVGFSMWSTFVESREGHIAAHHVHVSMKALQAKKM